MNTLKKLFILSFILINFTSTCLAVKLFAIDLDHSNGNLQVEDSSLPNLLSDFISGDGAFLALSGENTYSGNLRYFGLNDALTIAIDHDPNGVINIHLTSILTELDVTITATSEDDLEAKLVEWLYLEGGKEAAKLLQEAIKTSAATITDGNPGATTAQMANSTFYTFGLFQNTSREQNMRGFESGAHIALWVNSSSYTINTRAGKLEGSSTSINIPLWLHFGPRVSFVGNTLFDFNSLEGTEFYGLGANIGMAFRPVLRIEDDRFGWEITPYLGGQGIASVDGVTAAVLGQFGMINRFEWRFFDRSLLSFVTQYSTYNNLRIEINDYELATPIEQDIVKNGLMYDMPVFSLRSLYANLYLVDTRFLEDAKVDNYQTLGGGLSYRLKAFSINAYVAIEKTSDYQSNNGGLGFVWDL